MPIPTASNRVRPSILVLLVALVLGMIAVPSPGRAAAASDEAEVIFDGAGWGHGVGLSQYGAWALSVLGASSAEILAHYYQGTSLGDVGAAPPLWVNLELDFDALTLSVHDVGGTPGLPVSITSPAGAAEASSGATITIAAATPSGCSVSVTDGTGAVTELVDPACSVDFSWYDWATAGTTPTTKVRIDGCTLSDWNVIPTTQRPCEYARGMLHLRSGAGGLDLSAEMLLEDYVLGISEMPFAWNAAALEAQAIAARSYARELQITRGDPADNSCDAWCHVRDTTFDQRYVGWGHGATAPWVAAVTATAGQVVTHADAPNGVVRTYYFSSSGGATENGHERFSGLAPAEYLSSVDDTWAIDGTVPNPRASWQEVLTAAEVAAAVGLDQLTSVEVTARRTGSGSAATVAFGGVLGGGAS